MWAGFAVEAAGSVPQDTGMVLGVEIGGTKTQVGRCDARTGRPTLLVRRRVERSAGREGILRQLRELIPPLLPAVSAIGVGFGGPVDTATGRAVTSHQIEGWDWFPLRRWFEREFGLPVVVENDTNCAGFAEATQGAGRGARTVFYFNVGTGVGGALVRDRQLYDGRYGAMEFGHMRRDDGRTLESVASGLAIEQGVSTVAESGRYVGEMLANVITLLNPDVVVVGGGVAQAGREFWAPMREAVRARVFGPFRGNYRLRRARFGQAVVVVGAALLAGRQG